MKCPGCGEEFEPSANAKSQLKLGKKKSIFCSRDCYDRNRKSTFCKCAPLAIAWNVFNRMDLGDWSYKKCVGVPDVPGYRSVRGHRIPVCYVKEARAIIEGKHWQGKNKCVQLLGDEVSA